MTTGDVVYSLRFLTHQRLLKPGFEFWSSAAESSETTACPALCPLYSDSNGTSNPEHQHVPNQRTFSTYIKILSGHFAMRSGMIKS